MDAETDTHSTGESRVTLPCAFLCSVDVRRALYCVAPCAQMLTAASGSSSGGERFEHAAAVADALITGPARHLWLLSVTLCWCEHVISTLASQKQCCMHLLCAPSGEPSHARSTYSASNMWAQRRQCHCANDALTHALRS